MNKIYSLLDPNFVAEFFQEKIVPLYPEIRTIEKIEIKPYKKLIWETTYHVVFGYSIYCLDIQGREKKIPLVCSAHSEEPRENVLSTLRYLWQQGLPTETIKLPRPLFYDKEFRATFYRALPGANLLHYIKKRDQESVANLVVGAAKMFARLHRLPITNDFVFNPDNQRIATVVPGEEFIKQELKERFPGGEYLDLPSLYRRCAEEEEKYFSAFSERFLIHGDAHPENIIKVGSGKIGLIDFTDFCPADFARDLGAFLQQVEYKINRKVGDLEFARKMKQLFLSEYLVAADLRLTEDIQKRINLYYDWTALRTAVYWFLKHHAEPERGRELLDLVHVRQKTNRPAQE